MKRILALVSLLVFASVAAFAMSAEQTLEKVYGVKPAVSGETYTIELSRTDLGSGLVSTIQFTRKYEDIFSVSGDLVVTKKEELPVKLNLANTVGFSNISSSGGDIQHLKFDATGNLSQIANSIQVVLYYDTNTPMGHRR